MAHGNGLSALAGDCLGSFKLPADVTFAIARGKGAEVWDSAGNRYHDYLMGSGPMLIGHAHPRVVDAIARQAALGTHFYHLNEKAIELAERVRRLVPCAEAVKFCSDGSEATFYALRLARAFTRRTKIVKFDGAFHGHHDYARQRRSPGPSNQPFSEADTSGIPSCISESVLIAPFNDIATTRDLARAWADEIAGIIVEPVQRNILPQPGFLEGLRQLADEIGAVLIFDEIVTGFRLAVGGAQEFFGVTPDLCALGKALGGGTALAAVAGRADIMELTDPARADDGRSVFMSGTLNGNPLGCAAGLATLDVIEEENVPEQLRRKGESLAAGLCAVAHDLSIDFRMSGAPSIQQPVFVKGTTDGAGAHGGNRPQAERLFGLELVKHGILVNPGSKIYMALPHDEASEAAFLDAARQAMRAVRDSGLLEGA